jgi:hypothetical protein
MSQDIGVTDVVGHDNRMGAAYVPLSVILS